MNKLNFKKATLMVLSSISIVITSTNATYANNLHTDFYKSYSYEQVGDWNNSAKALLLHYKNNPNDYTLNLRLGYLYFSDKKYANAIDHYENAIAANPKAVSPLLGLMRVRNAQGQYKRAEEVGYRILSLDLNNYYGNLSLAYALRMSKKYELAKKITSKILTHYPEDTLFLQEHALNQSYLGDRKGASSTYSYLLLLEPENVAAKEYFGSTQKETK